MGFNCFFFTFHIYTFQQTIAQSDTGAVVKDDLSCNPCYKLEVTSHMFIMIASHCEDEQLIQLLSNALWVFPAYVPIFLCFLYLSLTKIYRFFFNTVCILKTQDCGRCAFQTFCLVTSSYQRGTRWPLKRKPPPESV